MATEQTNHEFKLSQNSLTIALFTCVLGVLTMGTWVFNLTLNMQDPHHWSFTLWFGAMIMTGAFLWMVYVSVECIIGDVIDYLKPTVATATAAQPDPSEPSETDQA